MPRFTLFAALFSLFILNLVADDFDNTDLGLQVGYRHDNFSIKSRHHHNPTNDVTKQSWNNISLCTFGINGSTYNEYNVYLRGNLVYGQAYLSGCNLDIPNIPAAKRDHRHNCRGNSYEASIAVGFPIWLRCCAEWLHFIPLAGFDYDRLKFRGRRVFSDPLPGTEFSDFHMNRHEHHPDSHSSQHHHHDCSDLKSRAHNRVTIESPWIGLDFVAMCCRWRLRGGYEYHFGRIRSHCSFTLKKNFIYTLSDRGNGHGNVVNFTAGYQLSTEWEAGLSFYYKDWVANSGKHKAKFHTVNSTLHAHSKLIKAEWESWEIAFNLLLRY